MTLQAWINKPKNQKLLFLIIGCILLYLYIKNKEKSAAANLGAYTGGSTGGRVDTPSGGGSTDSGAYFYNTTSLPFSATKKGFFTLVKNGNTYSDAYAGDSLVSGQKRITANGRTYTAYYWINEIPYANSDGTPKAFTEVTLPPGLLVTIRKVYAETSWVQTFDALRAQAYEAWYLNSNGDENRTYKTAMVSITT